MKIVGKWMTDKITGRSFLAIGTDVGFIYDASGVPYSTKDCRIATDVEIADACWVMYGIIKEL